MFLCRPAARLRVGHPSRTNPCTLRTELHPQGRSPAIPKTPLPGKSRSPPPPPVEDHLDNEAVKTRPTAVQTGNPPALAHPVRPGCPAPGSRVADCVIVGGGSEIWAPLSRSGPGQLAGRARRGRRSGRVQGIRGVMGSGWQRVRLLRGPRAQPAREGREEGTRTPVGRVSPGLRGRGEEGSLGRAGGEGGEEEGQMSHVPDLPPWPPGPPSFKQSLAQGFLLGSRSGGFRLSSHLLLSRLSSSFFTP